MTSAIKPLRQETPVGRSSGLSHSISEKGIEFVASGREYTLRCLEDPQAILEMKDEWIALESKVSEGYDYFQTFDWCFGWCKNHLENDEKVPRVFVLSNDNKVCLIWPLIKVRSVAGLTFLETMTEPLGQYSNLLFDPELVDTTVGRQIWNIIKENTSVDAICLNHYPADSFIDHTLGDEGIDEAVQFVSSILDYSQISSWENYVASFTKSQRKQRSRCLRKLEAEGELTFHVHFHDENRFAGLVNDAIDMKREWLSDTGRHSQNLFKESSRSFLSELGQYVVATEGEGPVVFSLCMNGKPIAIEIGMLKDKHYYSYLGAIDLEWRNFSPGKIQIEFAQKWAFEAGVEYFDFLSDPSDYKKSWTNIVKPVKTRYFPVSTRGRIYCSLWKAHMKPMLRTMYQQANPNMRKRLNKLLGLRSKNG